MGAVDELEEAVVNRPENFVKVEALSRSEKARYARDSLLSETYAQIKRKYQPEVKVKVAGGKGRLRLAVEDMQENLEKRLKLSESYSRFNEI